MSTEFELHNAAQQRCADQVELLADQLEFLRRDCVTKTECFLSETVRSALILIEGERPGRAELYIGDPDGVDPYASMTRIDFRLGGDRFIAMKRGIDTSQPGSIKVYADGNTYAPDAFDALKGMNQIVGILVAETLQPRTEVI